MQDPWLDPEGYRAVGAEAVGTDREGLGLPAAAQAVPRVRRGGCRPAALAAGLAAALVLLAAASRCAPQREPTVRRPPLTVGLASEGGAAAPAEAGPAGGSAPAAAAPAQTEVEVVVDVPEGQTQADLEAQLAAAKEALDAKIAAALEASKDVSEVATGRIGASTHTDTDANDDDADDSSSMSFDYDSLRIWLAIASTICVTATLVTFILFCARDGEEHPKRRDSVPSQEPDSVAPVRRQASNPEWDKPVFGAVEDSGLAAAKDAAEQGAQHVLVVRVVQAWGLTNDPEKSRPYVRVRILDPEGKEKQVKETAPIVDGGSRPQWNEYLQFEGIEDPALCSVRLEIRDKSDAREGSVEVKLGVLEAASGFQQFRDVVADGWFSDTELRFDLNNFGTWGNSASVENKLSLTIIGASDMEDMDTGIGGLFADENDPYVYIELVDEDGHAIGEPRQTKVIQEGGRKVDWNETFEFGHLLCPSAYKLRLSIWDKDTCKMDDALGKTEFALGRCFRVAEPMSFKEKLDVGNANLTFSICTGGAWGALTKKRVLEDPPAKWAAPAVPPGHYMKCNVLSATGLAPGSRGNDGKADPVCRLVLRDERGRTIETVLTKGKEAKAKTKAKPKAKAKNKARAKKDPKPDVEWDEGFLFKGIPNPCLCTLSVNVLDAAGEQGKRLGETTLPLGMLAAKPGLQDFEPDIAGFFWSSKVKLQIDNFGSWGNGQPQENKLYMMIKGARGLPTHVGALIRDKTDPYINVCLKGPDGRVLQTRSTKPKPDAGSDPQWDEELVFESIENPAACSLYIRVYDDSAGKDQKLGHTELPCGVLSCSSEYTAFDGTTLGGTCKLDFSMHTGGTWGNKEPGPEPVEAVMGGAQGCCSVCSVM